MLSTANEVVTGGSQVNIAVAGSAEDYSWSSGDAARAGWEKVPGANLVVVNNPAKSKALVLARWWVEPVCNSPADVSAACNVRLVLGGQIGKPRTSPSGLNDVLAQGDTLGPRTVERYWVVGPGRYLLQVQVHVATRTSSSVFFTNSWMLSAEVYRYFSTVSRPA